MQRSAHSRRTIVISRFACFCITGSLILISLVTRELVADTLRPNIVMIISDDQKYSDFGFMGNQRVRTPHLDELARRSARFTHGYVPSSVCRPSLVTLLTGLYPHQHGIHFNHPPPGFSKLTKSPEINKQAFDRLREEAASMIRKLPTLPRMLADSGYRCFQTGKYWEGHWKNAGFTEGMTIAEPSGGANGDKQLANGQWVAHGNGDHGLAIGRETMQPIEDFLDDVGPTPFFLWYAPFLPHTPHDSPPAFVKPFQSRSDIAKHEIPYFAAIAQFDATVGSIVDSIERRGLTKNTIFVFVVDNGWEPDSDRYVTARREWDHTKHSKRAPFDAGLRTPILVCWDGKTSPMTHDTPVSSIDLMPTLLAASTVSAGELTLPGTNLWPAAVGELELEPDRAVFGEIYPGDASVLGDPSRDLAYRWIRRERYKLIIPHSVGGKPAWNRYIDRPALYDVLADPEETRNQIGEPDLATTRAELENQLNRWWSPH